jgi:hypothetical protein
LAFGFSVLSVLPDAGKAQDSDRGAGRLLQMQRLGGAPDGATANKVYYQSTGLRGELAIKRAFPVHPAAVRRAARAV